MTAKFYAVGSFHIRSRNLFVLVGDVIEGSVETGMNVVVELGNLSATAKIASAEVIDVDYLSKSYKGLVFAYDEPEELGFWASLKLSDETFVIERAD